MASNEYTFRELHEALIEAFPLRGQLEFMVRGRLNERLEEIAHYDDLNGKVYALITVMESRGTIAELVGAAIAERPRNPKLRAVAVKMGLSGPDEGPTASNTNAIPRQPWNIPEPSPYFTDILEGSHNLHTLATLLQRPEEPVSRQVILIHGLGGIGKSQSVRRYAHQFRDHYRAGFLVSAASEDTLLSGFAEVAKLLPQRPPGERDPRELADHARDWLATHGDWLLILDGADEPGLLKDWLSTGPRGHVLVTSRLRSMDGLGIADRIELPIMEVSQAVKFLLRRTGRQDDCESDERQKAAELAVRLGCLPLALEQAAAFISAHVCRFADYSDRLQQCCLELLESQPPTEGGYHATVRTTWERSLRNIENHTPSADLLRFCAFLARAEIPEELLISGRSALSPELSRELSLARDNPLKLTGILKPLLEQSLVRRRPDHQTFLVQPLVQDVVQSQLSRARREEWARRVVHAVDAAFPEIEIHHWKTCRRLLPHAEEASKLIDQYRIHDAAAARLLNQFAGFLHHQGKDTEAELHYRKALEIELEIEGDPAETANLRNNLGVVLHRRGNLEEAAKQLGLAREYWTNAPRLNETGMIANLINLGNLFYDENRPREAEKVLQDARSLLEHAKPRDSTALALCLMSLQNLYLRQGRRDKAQEMADLMRKVQDAHPAQIPEGHPVRAWSGAHLGSLAYSQEQFAEAEQLYEEALKIQSKSPTQDQAFVRLLEHNLDAIQHRRKQP